MRDARRPSVWPVASITYHSRCASPASLVSQELFCVVIMAFSRSGIVYKTAKRLSRCRDKRWLAGRSASPSEPTARPTGSRLRRDPDELHREARDQVDVGVERVDWRAIDLAAECPAAERPAPD